MSKTVKLYDVSGVAKLCCQRSEKKLKRGIMDLNDGG